MDWGSMIAKSWYLYAAKTRFKKHTKRLKHLMSLSSAFTAGSQLSQLKKVQGMPGLSVVACCSALILLTIYCEMSRLISTYRSRPGAKNCDRWYLNARNLFPSSHIRLNAIRRYRPSLCLVPIGSTPTAPNPAEFCIPPSRLMHARWLQ